MDNKKKYGQFYSTNYKLLLDGFTIPDGIKTIVEPFVGKGDLLKFINPNRKITIEKYDIDPKIEGTIKRDTLLNPISYTGKFILTNPPYLARGFSKKKDIYNKYHQDDLFRCFIKSIIDDVALGGILIVPLNFFSSIKKSSVNLRKDFLSVYNITRVNIYNCKVFIDTNYTVCSFQFTQKLNPELSIKMVEYPLKIHDYICLNISNEYTHGGGIYNLPTKGKYHIKCQTETNTKIFGRLLDLSDSNRISLKILTSKDIDSSKKKCANSRAFVLVNIVPKINHKTQIKLCDKFNELFNNYRVKYYSLFMTNFRGFGDGISKKCLSSFLFCKILTYILENIDTITTLDI